MKIDDNLIVTYKDERIVINKTLLNIQDAWDSLDKIKSYLSDFGY